MEDDMSATTILFWVAVTFVVFAMILPLGLR
jgi:membrane protein insertase Oxa1/YidC/SpoIIIJ